jgi:pyruvate-ferredoxin/flavodoxin oxidoreductase
LYRFQPSETGDGQPLRLDSKAPTIPVRDFVATETRYAILARTDPVRARHLSGLLQADIDERWRYYEQLASMHRTVPHVDIDDDVEPEVENDAGYRYESEDMA